MKPRSLIQEIKKHKGQLLITFFLIFMGLLVYISLGYTKYGLDVSVKQYYLEHHQEEYRFVVNEAPKSEILEKLSKVEGIQGVHGRLVQERVIQTPGGSHTQARLVGISLEDQQKVDTLAMISGDYPKQSGEIVIEKKFAEANQIFVGDYFLYEGNPLLVTGIGVAPSYMVVIKSNHDLIYDSKDFGVLFVLQDDLEELLGKSNQINEILITLNDDKQIQEVREVLAPYLIVNEISRAENPVFSSLDFSFMSLQVMSICIYAFLVWIALIILYNMISRKAISEKEYLLRSNANKSGLVWNYILLGLIPVILATLLAIPLGLYLGEQMGQIYSEAYTLPYFHFEVAIAPLILGVFPVIFIIIAMILIHLQKGLRQKKGKEGQTQSRWAGNNVHHKKADHPWKVGFREIINAPYQSIITLVMIVFMVTLLFFSLTMIENVNRFSSNVMESDYDLLLLLEEEISEEQLAPFLEKEYEKQLLLPYVYMSGEKSIPVSVQGISTQPNVLKLVNQKGETAHPTNEGAIISLQLANQAKVNVGDILSLTSSTTPDLDIKVADIAEQYMGLDIYVPIDKLQDDSQVEGINQIIFNAVTFEEVVGLMRETSYPNYRISESAKSKTEIAQTSGLLTMLNGQLIFLALVLGIAYLYHVLTLKLEKDKADLLKVLKMGYKKNEISSGLYRQIWIIAILGISIGLFLGSYLFVEGIGIFNSSEEYSIPAQITPQNYIQTIALSALPFILCRWYVSKRVKRFLPKDQKVAKQVSL